MRTAVLLAGSLAAAGCAADAPSPPADVAVAPMPREDSRIEFKDYKGRGVPAAEGGFNDANGVRFTVTGKVRRLVSTGRDVIDLDWKVEYSGPRPPLILMPPSLTEGWPEMTRVGVYAFPRGSETGRYVRFATPEPDGGVRLLIFEGVPKAWYLTVPKGEVGTGNVSLLVADLKALLQSRYPAEFPDAAPPKLYADLLHEPTDRGYGHDLDAWTGLLMSNMLELPDLKSW
jgi:hypothetical protein